MSSPSDVAKPASVRLRLPAKPENVALARQVLAGLADGLDLDEDLLADINIAVTEACNNVVLHAYPEDAEGAVEITITALLEQLVISVRDEGAGINPFPTEDDAASRLGFGFAMMSSLSDQFGINSGAGGTEVRMRFAIGGEPAPEGDDLLEGARLVETGPAPAGDVVLVLTPGAPAGAVLGRYVSLLAARANLSIDRMSDLQMVSDTLALHAPRRALNGALHVSAADHDSGFDLRVGPLQAGGSEALVADATLAGVGSLLHLLSDEVIYEPAGEDAPGAEVLRLRLTRSPAPS